ncbi:MAG TPA: hypothetical protein VFY93_01135 [Planctomycetota bacterium]|nr:hypothetical protein [Planctomycetota bacterium]
MGKWWSLRCLCLVLLVSCGGGGGGSSYTGGSILGPRPAGAPDVVVLSVSGHDGAISGLLCTSDTNRSYLGDPGDAIDAVVDAILDLGLTVEVGNFADRLLAPDLDRDGQPDNGEQYGFAELLATMQWVFDEWMDGVANPTKLVLVAHSHGATWAHMATSVMSHIPVSSLVTLDGICSFWECEHAEEVADWVAANGLVFAWDIAHPCDAWTVGAAVYNTKDVAFDNVAVNLEVQSADPFVSDCCDNVRLDGTSDGIATYTSGEDHNGVRGASSDAMTWVGDWIRINGVP